MIYGPKLLVYSLTSQRAVQSWLRRAEERAGMAPEQPKNVALRPLNAPGVKEVQDDRMGPAR